MTADRKWMEQLGFALEDNGSTLWVVVDDCGGERLASLAEIVLWTSLTAPAAPIAPELDVTKILLNVVPGDDGEGLEIYAKSVDDVVALLTKQGERIEELESRVAGGPAAPAEPMTWEQAVRKHINDTEYAERLLALPDDATAEQVHACAPRHHAPVAPALKYVDDPKQTGVGSWCAPGPAAEQKRMFVLRFEDQDRGEAHYTDEAEARAMFARAEARGWNCHLFVHVNRVAPVAPAEPAEGWVLVPKRMTQEMRDVTDSEGFFLKVAK